MAICFYCPIKPTIFTPSPIKLQTSTTPTLLRCNLSLLSKTLITTKLEPVYTSVKSFAPATVANLGSSAASDAAASVAVNEIFGGNLGFTELVHVGLESKAKVSCYHADNIAPTIMGR